MPILGRLRRVLSLVKENEIATGLIAIRGIRKGYMIILCGVFAATTPLSVAVTKRQVSAGPTVGATVTQSAADDTTMDTLSYEAKCMTLPNRRFIAKQVGSPSTPAAPPVTAKKNKRQPPTPDICQQLDSSCSGGQTLFAKKKQKQIAGRSAPVDVVESQTAETAGLRRKSLSTSDLSRLGLGESFSAHFDSPQQPNEACATSRTDQQANDATSKAKHKSTCDTSKKQKLVVNELTSSAVVAASKSKKRHSAENTTPSFENDDVRVEYVGLPVLQTTQPPPVAAKSNQRPTVAHQHPIRVEHASRAATNEHIGSGKLSSSTSSGQRTCQLDADHNESDELTAGDASNNGTAIEVLSSDSSSSEAPRSAHVTSSVASAIAVTTSCQVADARDCSDMSDAAHNNTNAHPKPPPPPKPNMLRRRSIDEVIADVKLLQQHHHQQQYQRQRPLQPTVNGHHALLPKRVEIQAPFAKPPRRNMAPKNVTATSQCDEWGHDMPSYTSSQSEAQVQVPKDFIGSQEVGRNCNIRGVVDKRANGGPLATRTIACGVRGPVQGKPMPLKPKPKFVMKLVNIEIDSTTA